VSFKNILVPTDGSEYTKGAIEKALELAELSGGKITALCVLDKSTYTNSHDAAVVNVYDTLEKEGSQATRYVTDRGKEMNIPVEEKLVDGTPAKIILQESENYDIIVMGTLGRTGLSKLIMGSVAERVVQNAKCPVMVVKSSISRKE
jgi:Universal stress protein UspA and related nucleotide-binding proteins